MRSHNVELPPQDGHLVIIGQTGLGKTALVKTLLRAGRQGWNRVLIADPAEEYGAVAVGVASIDAWAEYVGRAGTSWCVAYQGDDLDTMMPALCEAAYTMGQVHVIAEEADLWCNPSQILPELAHVLKYGRKRGVWLCGVARRPSEVHRLLTSMATHVIAFGTVEGIDVDYLRRNVSAEFAQAVQQLDPLEAAWWDRRHRQLVRLRVDPAALRVQVLDKEESPAVE